MDLKLYVATTTEGVGVTNRTRFTIVSEPELTDVFGFQFFDDTLGSYVVISFAFQNNGVSLVIPKAVPYTNEMQANIVAAYLSLYNFSYPRVLVIYEVGNNYFDFQPLSDQPIISIDGEGWFTHTAATIQQPAYRLLNLFQDETIQYVNKLTDIEKLSNIFTDVTNTFTIPADDNNLEIYKQYLDLDITNPINANLRQPALIELDTFTFRYGRMTLESGSIINGRPESLKVTFYGSLTQITDLIADDTLAQLDYVKDDFGNLTKRYANISKFDYAITQENVTKLIDGTTYKDGLMIPLIHLGDKEWNYGTNVNNTVSQDIATSVGAVDTATLRPALKIRELFTAIQEKYDLTFTNQFLDEAQFNNLYMWLNGDAKERYGGNFILPIKSDFTLTAKVDPGAPNPTVPRDYVTSLIPGGKTIKIEKVNNGSNSPLLFCELFWPNNNLLSVDGKEFTMTVSFIDRRTVTDGDVIFTKTQTFQPGDYVTFATPQFPNPLNLATLGVTIGNPLLFDIYITVDKAISWTEYEFWTTHSYTTTLFNQFYRYKSNNLDLYGLGINLLLPNMKVIDFIQGIMKMFKLILRPITTNTFEFTTLDNYYAGGDLLNITGDVDNSSIEISRPEIYKKIDLLFEKTNNVLGAEFRHLNDLVNDRIGYGDLTFLYNSVDSKNNLEVKLPFENMLFERMTNKSVTPATETKILFGESIAVSDSGTITENNSKAILFYNNGRTLISPIKFKFNNGTEFTVSQSYLIGNTNNEFLEQVTNTINWGSENDPWHRTRVDNSLYLNYWSKWIASIYDIRQKKITLTANLSQKFLNRLSLNDTLIVTNNRYRINDYKTDLLSGKTEFTLFRDFSQLSEFDFEESPFILDKVELSFNRGTSYYGINLLTKGKWEVIDVSGNGVTCLTTSGEGPSEIVFKSSNWNMSAGINREIEFKVRTVDQTPYQENNILITQLGG